MRWTFAAEDAETPAHAREAVRSFAAEQGADADTLAAIELCVSEAVSNAAVHAYRKLGRRGPVEVEVRRPEGYLCVYVRDHGSGLRRRPDSPGLGLGLPLIQQAASSLDVRPRRCGGTEVLMVFELSGSRVKGAA
jgi:serine/threonine-protein kinase RsbW/stage II sporulation protein AB (anti-sigma F factor)